MGHGIARWMKASPYLAVRTAPCLGCQLSDPTIVPVVVKDSFDLRGTLPGSDGYRSGHE